MVPPASNSGSLVIRSISSVESLITSPLLMFWFSVSMRPFFLVEQANTNFAVSRVLFSFGGELESGVLTVTHKLFGQAWSRVCSV